MTSTMEPFDAHDAKLGELGTLVTQFRTLATQGYDLQALTARGFRPAVDNWSGIAAPELQAADDPLRRNADDTRARLAWAAVALQFFITKVTEFNESVADLDDSMTTARHHAFYVHADDGQDPSRSAVAEARRRFTAEKHAGTTQP